MMYTSQGCFTVAYAPACLLNSYEMWLEINACQYCRTRSTKFYNDFVSAFIFAVVGVLLLGLFRFRYCCIMIFGHCLFHGGIFGSTFKQHVIAESPYSIGLFDLNGMRVRLVASEFKLSPDGGSERQTFCRTTGSYMMDKAKAIAKELRSTSSNHKIWWIGVEAMRLCEIVLDEVSRTLGSESVRNWMRIAHATYLNRRSLHTGCDSHDWMKIWCQSMYVCFHMCVIKLKALTSIWGGEWGSMSMAIKHAW